MSDLQKGQKSLFIKKLSLHIMGVKIFSIHDWVWCQSPRKISKAYRTIKSTHLNFLTGNKPDKDINYAMHWDAKLTPVWNQEHCKFSVEVKLSLLRKWNTHNTKTRQFTSPYEYPNACRWNRITEEWSSTIFIKVKLFPLASVSLNRIHYVWYIHS